ncbi:MAG: hypothetical protein ACOC9S_00565 [Planctomycetota bacterium]
MTSRAKNTTLAAIAASVLVLTATCIADTVVMESGKTYTGRAERRGETVRIEMDHGTIDVSAEDVLYIIPSEDDDATGAGEDAESAEPDDAPRAPTRTATTVNAARPEPMLFMLMRRLERTAAGGESFTLRQQVRRYRIMAHERKRKVGGRWVDPDYFRRGRQAFAEKLAEADELAKRVDRVRGDDPSDEAQRRRLRQQAATQCRSAAKQWPDPLLGKFLRGIAELYAENYRRAERHFSECVDDMPQVAGFHQGRALAFRGLRQHAEELTAAMETLCLRPESAQALAMVVDAMDNIPGAETDKPPYSDAREMLADYQDVDSTVRRARRGVRWLMPGLRRDWNVRDEKSMPELPYDRLSVRQAVAVAVGEQFVLVDAEAVDGAEEVLVGTEDGRVFPADEARISTFGRRGSLPALRVLGVPGATFTPAEPAESVEEGSELVARAVEAFRQMGKEPREFTTSITSDGDILKPSVALLAGESASPLMTEDGSIAAFLAARTDPAEDGGGPSRVIPAEEIRELLDASRMRISRGGFAFGSSRAERDAEPVAVEGQSFIVYGIFGETFE